MTNINVNNSTYSTPKVDLSQQNKTEKDKRASASAEAVDTPQAASLRNESNDTAGLGAQQQSSSAVSKEELSQVVSKLGDFAQSIERNLSFRIDEQSGRTIVSVIDAETKEVIREIPGEDALKLAQEIDNLRSLVFSVRA